MNDIDITLKNIKRNINRRQNIVYLKNNNHFFLKNNPSFSKASNCSQMFIYLFKLILFLNIILNNQTLQNKKEIRFYFSYITLKVNQEGKQTILSSWFKYNPDEIYINDNITSCDKYKKIVLNNSSNPIKLVWFNEINNTDNMFYELKNIIEIDLSNFNASLVISMNCMFFGCNNLKSINFSNFDTSQVISMTNTFCSCSSLNSLDVSSFNTSKVNKMDGMFSGCYNLASLNISNFDTSQVVNMDNMFSNCKELVSLNLTNFITSSVNKMNQMFKGCEKLITLN